MLIDKANFTKNCLDNKTVLITGGGGGIGFEACRALVQLGANVIIAEIDKQKGMNAEKSINDELNTKRAEYYYIDISDEEQINKLYSYINQKYGFLDVIINNATITPMGAIDDVSIFDWDKSYAVNLRAPVLLTQKFLPNMKEKNTGTIVFVSSSGSAPYMGAYEIFKTAQVDLCNTLAGELENTNIYTYTIGPGLVKTDTAQKAIQKVSSLMKIPLSEFYKMNESHILDVESAGTGYAVSVVLASFYNGKEIGSIQALLDANIYESPIKVFSKSLSKEEIENLKTHIHNVVKTYNEQHSGWLQRNIFERQWVLRDFKKTVGFSVEQVRDKMIVLNELAEKKSFDTIFEYENFFEKLAQYYQHQNKLLQGFEKNPERLKANSQILCSYVKELELIINIIK